MISQRNQSYLRHVCNLLTTFRYTKTMLNKLFELIVNGSKKLTYQLQSSSQIVQLQHDTRVE